MLPRSRRPMKRMCCGCGKAWVITAALATCIERQVRLSNTVVSSPRLWKSCSSFQGSAGIQRGRLCRSLSIGPHRSSKRTRCGSTVGCSVIEMIHDQRSVNDCFGHLPRSLSLQRELVSSIKRSRILVRSSALRLSRIVTIAPSHRAVERSPNRLKQKSRRRQNVLKSRSFLKRVSPSNRKVGSC